MRRRRVRLFLRLTADVNDRLRTLMRYHGKLSRYIDEALSSDLKNIGVDPRCAREDRPRTNGGHLQSWEPPATRRCKAARLQCHSARE